MASADNFTNKIVTLVVFVVLVALVAIPIINGMVGTDVAESGTPGTDGYIPAKDYPIDAGTTEATIIQILPVFLVLAIMLVIVKWFMGGKE